jgi:peptidoglycan hydrolase-like protein with peptidoglycan-binding domain
MGLEAVDYGTIISASVGKGGRNKPEDVRLVQRLLNDARVREKSGERLVVDGIAGPKTDAAILQFQGGHSVARDGRIDPGGPTLKRLVDDHLASLQAGLIMPYIARGALGTVPKPSPQLIDSVIRSYLESLRS